ncbi:MAG: adenylate/guanylate cyclase domain-containing protein [Rhizomicrobium sp.]
MQRKLTAILSADVVGYSGLMEADETGTLERLKANRTRIFDPQVAIHGGRIFKLIGDGALAEFPSVISAVECALAIQAATEKAAGASRIRYRIGINLGEVIVEDDDIYGDGVNVAARLQALAPVGGVAVSRTVHDNARGKISCTFDDLGEHTVKNIETPVHVFSVRPARATDEAERPKPEPAHKLSICVLPFSNMSGDTEQEYFSDGISEDIITDLSKVSALSVVARNTAFTFKGKSLKIPQVARELSVSHVLEGSVRKSGGRVRITAQLIDGAAGDHVWAERYDRNLDDIFALQDEISQAIVGALRLVLLPEEKKAIERRGTENVEAYNLYLMARQNFTTGNFGDVRRDETVIRLCTRATEIDPSYARAWALLAMAQNSLRYQFARDGDGGQASVERALALDANLAEAHAVLALLLHESGRHDEALAELATALRMDPDSHEVNRAAAYSHFRRRRIVDAIAHFEKSAAILEADFSSSAMLITCYTATGDAKGQRRAAEMTLARVEKVIALDRNNGAAIGLGVSALMVLGEAERAKEWMARGLLIDPDNMNMRYNFACDMAAQMGDKDRALELLGPVLATMSIDFLNHAKADPDFDSLRDDPRFQAMIAAAEARLAAEG